MATQAMNMDMDMDMDTNLIPAAENKIISPNEASSTPMVVSDDDGHDDDDDDTEEATGEIFDESALDCSSVVESDSEWGVDDDDDGGVVMEENMGSAPLSAANLEQWLFSSGEAVEDVVSEDDADMETAGDHMDLEKQETADTSASISTSVSNELEKQDAADTPASGVSSANDSEVAPESSGDETVTVEPTGIPAEETPVSTEETVATAAGNQMNESAEDALSRIKAIDKEKVKTQQSQLADKAVSNKAFFEPVAPQLAPAERRMQDTRTSKEMELEALRNRGLAGRKSRQLKETINKNLKVQIDEAQRNGDMEWKKIGGGDDSQDEIEIGAITAGTATSPQLQQATSPVSAATSPSMALEQLAMEQQKERNRARELEQETLIQNHLHPESQRKTEQKLLEMDFVFGLLLNKDDPPPKVRAATKAAAKIVPNMLKSKKTIYYDPRYPPKVAFVELDEAYDSSAANKGKLSRPQKRYMVRGRVPVLPRKRSNRSSKSSSDPKSPSTANATISTQPLTPLTAAGSASNSLSSSTELTTAKEALAIPSMEEVASPASTDTANTSVREETTEEEAGVVPTASEDAEMADVLEGPMHIATHEILEETELNVEAEEMAKAASSPKSKRKTNLVVATRSSSTNIKSIRVSKDAELESIRQRGVAKQKNLGFAQLEAQSALSKAAYEKEQQDLQKRKSGASEFQFAAGRIVNPHEQLYLQQNKQNRSYREIQQKTMEDYHRISPSGERVDKKDDNGDTPSGEDDTAANKNDETTPFNPKQPSSERISLQARDQSSRQSRYDKIFQKIRPKSKKSMKEDEIDPIWHDASTEKNTEPAVSEEERQRRYEAMFQKQKSEPSLDVKSSDLKFEQIRAAKQAELKALSFEPSVDVKSSEIKFEEIRTAKQEELKALRARGLQHRTSDGKVRMSSEDVQVAKEQEQATPTTPARRSSDGLVGFGMFVKKSPARPSGNLGLNPAGAASNSQSTGQAWRASDDASPSRLKHSSLKNKEAEELARLRNQGLAKRGSQQYAVFEKISREAELEYLAAAEDLARRKSQTSDYVYNGTKEINPVDAVYLDHQKWRKDAMKENKEALGLFDEAPAHVDQEDVEGQIPVSNAKFSNTNGYQKWESGDRTLGGKKKKKIIGVESKCGCTIM
ncbi:MAG: hypothetical protein SGBAC_012923 [Bacillariaceae sp.]